MLHVWASVRSALQQLGIRTLHVSSRQLCKLTRLRQLSAYAAWLPKHAGLVDSMELSVRCLVRGETFELLNQERYEVASTVIISSMQLARTMHPGLYAAAGAPAAPTLSLSRLPSYSSDFFTSLAVQQTSLHHSAWESRLALSCKQQQLQQH